VLQLQVDTDDLETFLTLQRQILQAARRQAHSDTQQILHRHLTLAFQECHDRVKTFADWYFAYSTTYHLLSTAMKSATKHALRFGRTTAMRGDEPETLQQAVTRDLQDYICDKYQAIVLKPALTDPKLHRAVVAALEDAYTDVYRKALTNLDDSVHAFVLDHTKDHIDGGGGSSNMSSSMISPDSIVLELDWKAQLQKVHHLPMAYEKNPPEFSLALVGASTVAGKAMGGTAIKILTGKLAAPFATKAVGATLGGKAAAGAAAGATAGGPVGALAGAAVGIGMDMTVNAGVALMQRSTFERDVEESLDATLLEWEDRLLPEVERVVRDIWFGQAEAMLVENTKNISQPLKKAFQ
jgi:hypothetical protein